MFEPHEELQRRRPVWEALSGLFLDSELQDYDFAFIARILAESGNSDKELQRILLDEVFPACIPNLLHPAGIWTGFRLDWLEEQIVRNAAQTQAVADSPPPDYWMIEKEWRQVLVLLPEARRKQP